MFLQLIVSEIYWLSWFENFAARIEYEQSIFVPEISRAIGKTKIMQIRNVQKLVRGLKIVSVSGLPVNQSNYCFPFCAHYSVVFDVH